MNLYWITFSTGVQEATGVGSGLCRNTHFLLASFVLFFFFFLSFCFFCIETPSLNLFCVHALNPEAMVLKPNQEWRLDPLILTLKPQVIPRTEWISFNVDIWETCEATIWVSILEGTFTGPWWCHWESSHLMPFQATGPFSDHKGSDCSYSRILTTFAPLLIHY